MASKNSVSLALFLALSILFVTLTAATDCGCNPKPKHKPVPGPKHKPVPSPKPKHVPSPSVPTPSLPTPSVPSPNPRPVTPPSSPGSSGNCPIDALKLGVCGNVLSSLLNLQLGQQSAQPCCSLIQGLVDLDAAICLCTALRANILGINLNVPISLSVLLNVCNKKLPSGFQCSSLPNPSVPSPSIPTPAVPTPSLPTPSVPSPSVPTPSVPTPSLPTPSVPTPSVPSPTPKPVTPPSSPGSSGNCPIDALKLGVCGNVLSNLLNLQLGQPSAQPCCSVIQGLVDLDAAVCLCTALRANVLGINLNVPISLSVLLNVCDRKLPSGFQCA